MPPAKPLGPDDLHNIVLLYLAVAYESDHRFDPVEHHTILRLIRRWMPEIAPAEAEAVVDTALKAMRGGMTGDVDALARSVGTVLPPSLRRRVLTDLGHVARADGFLSVEEANIIRRIRAVLDAAAGGDEQRRKRVG